MLNEYLSLSTSFTCPRTVLTGGDACQPAQVPDDDGRQPGANVCRLSHASYLYGVAPNVHAGRHDEWPTQVDVDANANATR